MNDDAIYELVKAVNSDVYKSLKLQSEVERNSLNLPYISKQVVSSGTNNFIKVCLIFIQVFCIAQNRNTLFQDDFTIDSCLVDKWHRMVR